MGTKRERREMRPQKHFEACSQNWEPWALPQSIPFLPHAMWLKWPVMQVRHSIAPQLHEKIKNRMETLGKLLIMQSELRAIGRYPKAFHFRHMPCG